MKRELILLLGFLVAGISYASTDIGMVDDKATVINMDADSHELVAITSFCVENPINVNIDCLIKLERVTTIDGFISEVEAEERGSPKLTKNFPKLRRTIAETRYLAIKSWEHRLSKTKSSVGITYDYSNRS